MPTKLHDIIIFFVTHALGVQKSILLHRIPFSLDCLTISTWLFMVKKACQYMTIFLIYSNYPDLVIWLQGNVLNTYYYYYFCFSFGIKKQPESIKLVKH